MTAAGLGSRLLQPPPMMSPRPPPMPEGKELYDALVDSGMDSNWAEKRVAAWLPMRKENPTLEEHEGFRTWFLREMGFAKATKRREVLTAVLPGTPQDGSGLPNPNQELIDSYVQTLHDYEGGDLSETEMVTKKKDLENLQNRVQALTARKLGDDMGFNIAGKVLEGMEGKRGLPIILANEIAAYQTALLMGGLTAADIKAWAPRTGKPEEAMAYLAGRYHDLHREGGWDSPELTHARGLANLSKASGKALAYVTGGVVGVGLGAAGGAAAMAGVMALPQIEKMAEGKVDKRTAELLAPFGSGVMTGFLMAPFAGAPFQTVAPGLSRAPWQKLKPVGASEIALISKMPPSARARAVARAGHNAGKGLFPASPAKSLSDRVGDGMKSLGHMAGFAAVGGAEQGAFEAIRGQVPDEYLPGIAARGAAESAMGLFANPFLPEEEQISVSMGFAIPALEAIGFTPETAVLLGVPLDMIVAAAMFHMGPKASGRAREYVNALPKPAKHLFVKARSALLSGIDELGAQWAPGWKDLSPKQKGAVVKAAVEKAGSLRSVGFTIDLVGPTGKGRRIGEVISGGLAAAIESGSDSLMGHVGTGAPAKSILHRAVQAGVVSPDGTITPEGRRIGLEHIERNEQAKSGLPISERKPGRGRLPTPKDGWVPSEVEGNPWYTDGRVLVKGTAPDYTGREIPADATKRERSEAKPNEVEPVAVALIKLEKAGEKPQEVLWFSEGTAVDAKYHDHIMRQFPDATQRVGKKGGAIGYFVGDEKVALLKPITPKTDVPPGVAKILAAEAKKAKAEKPGVAAEPRKPKRPKKEPPEVVPVEEVIAELEEAKVPLKEEDVPKEQGRLDLEPRVEASIEVEEGMRRLEDAMMTPEEWQEEVESRSTYPLGEEPLPPEPPLTLAGGEPRRPALPPPSMAERLIGTGPEWEQIRKEARAIMRDPALREPELLMLSKYANSLRKSDPRREEIRFLIDQARKDIEIGVDPNYVKMQLAPEIFEAAESMRTTDPLSGLTISEGRALEILQEDPRVDFVRPEDRGAVIAAVQMGIPRDAAFEIFKTPTVEEITSAALAPMREIDEKLRSIERAWEGLPIPEVMKNAGLRAWKYFLVKIKDRSYESRKALHELAWSAHQLYPETRHAEIANDLLLGTTMPERLEGQIYKAFSPLRSRIGLTPKSVRGNFERIWFMERLVERDLQLQKREDYTPAKGGVRTEEGDVIYSNEAAAELARMRESLPREEIAAIDETLRNIQKINDEGLDMVRESGLKSPEEVRRLKSTGRMYAPFWDLEHMLDGLASNMNIGDPAYGAGVFQRMVGGVGPMNNLVVAWAARQMQLRMETQRNEVRRAFMDAFDTPEAKQLGMSKDFVEGAKAPAGWSEVHAYRNGERHSIYLPTEVAESINGMSKESVGLVTRFFGASSRIFRSATTTYNLHFGISNFERDVQMLLVTTADLPHPMKYLAAAVVESFFPWASKDYKTLQEKGGLMGGWYASLRGEYAEARMLKLLPKPGETTRLYSPHAKLGKRFYRSHLWKYANPIRLAVAGPAYINSALEAIPRVTAYKAAEAAGLSLEVAVWRARRATIDFNVMGDHMRVLNMFVPFLNARLQANILTLEALMTMPLKVATRALPWFVIPEVISSLWNRSTPERRAIDDQMEPWYRDAYLSFFLYTITEKDEDGNDVEVPVYLNFRRGETMALLGAPARASTRLVETMDPYAALGTLVSSVVGTSPIDVSGFIGEEGGLAAGIARAGESVSPPLIAGVVAMGGEGPGYDPFRNREIETQAMRRRAPELRYTKKTTEVAKYLAKTMGLYSPVKWDYAIKRVLGTAVHDAVAMDYEQYGEGFMSRIISPRPPRKMNKVYKVLKASLEKANSASWKAAQDLDDVLLQIRDGAPVGEVVAQYLERHGDVGRKILKNKDKDLQSGRTTLQNVFRQMSRVDSRAEDGTEIVVQLAGSDFAEQDRLARELLPMMGNKEQATKFLKNMIEIAKEQAHGR